MKGSAGFSLWALNGVLLKGDAREPELCVIWGKQKMPGEKGWVLK